MRQKSIRDLPLDLIALRISIQLKAKGFQVSMSIIVVLEQSFFCIALLETFVHRALSLAPISSLTFLESFESCLLLTLLAYSLAYNKAFPLQKSIFQKP